MEMDLGHTNGAKNGIEILSQRMIALLFIPVLFALSTYAIDYTDVRTLRTALDPVVYKFAGVEGSMIGNCIRGTDKDPFQSTSIDSQNVEMCLVYLVKDEALIPKLRAWYKLLRIQTPIAVRFQKSLPAVVAR